MPRHGTATPEAVSTPEAVPTSPRTVGRGRGMSGWPIRRKLAALVAPPLLLILVAGAILAYGALSNLQDARKAQRISEAIVASGQANLALQEEINQAVVGSALAGAETNPTIVKNSITRLDTLIVTTDEARAKLLELLKTPPGGGWSADANQSRAAIAAQGPALKQARDYAHSKRSYTFADDVYQRLLAEQLSLTNSLARDLSVATSDPRLVSAATAISAMSGLADAASSERKEGATLLARAPISAKDVASPTQLGTFLRYGQTQTVQAEIASRFATVDARALLTNALAADTGPLDAYRRDVAALLGGIETDPDIRAGRSGAFSEAAGQRIRIIDRALTSQADDTRAIAGDVARGALLRVALVVGLALLMLVIGVGLAAVVSRTVTGPLRRLRSAAVEAATVRLPAAVRQIERQGPDAVPALPPVLPPGTAAGPETVEVAQAVDGLTTEALRLATAQVRLRQAIDEAFVSMSRRSQSMVEKQLSIIDELESTEEDPDQLRNLFRLDHLAARMRRYNDNLLVLAGSTVRTRSAAPVPVADIFRAATSEMEQYERVRLQPISGTAIAGPAAGGLIHLLAELLDNAAMYSPPTSPIQLTAQFMPDGGLHLEVTDSGVGIPPAELAELNARLNTPGTLDAQVPSRMGLFVVARLAQRGGLRVRLSPRSNAAGTVAEVIVPPALVAGGPAGDNQPAVFGDIPAAPAGPAGPGVTGPGAGGFPGAGGPGRAPTYPPFPVQSPAPGGSPAGPLSPDRGTPVPAGSSPLAPSAPSTPAARLGEPEPAGPAPELVADGSSLPSRRPGAVLSEGPLAAAAGPRTAETPSLPTPPPGSAGLFGVAAATSGNPFEPVLTPDATGETAATPADDDRPTEVRPPVRGATAAWSARPDAGALPTRARGAAMPPTLAPTARPAADSPTAVPPAPAFGGPSAFDAPAFGAPPVTGDALAGATSAPADALVDGPADAPEAAPADDAPAALPVLPRRTRGASAPPPAEAFAPPVVAPPFGDAPAAAPSDDVTSQPAPGPAAEPATAQGDTGTASSPLEPLEPAAPSAPAAGTPDPAGEPAGPAPLAAKAAPAQEVTAAGSSLGEGAALTGGLPVRTRGENIPVPLAKPAATPVPPVSPVAPAAHGGPNGHHGGNGSGRPAPASNGAAPAAWNPSLPTELAARSAADAAAQRYRPANPNAPMIGSDAPPATSAPTPIFDSISVWFSTDSTAPATGSVDEVERVVDLRDGARQPVAAGSGASTGRWAALGDQQWLAASARAAATPEIGGTTDTGLPMRRPGANLVPSAATASATVGAGARTGTVPGPMPPAPVHRADPESVRGRLGSYQRGLTSARRSRRAPGGGNDLFAGPQDGNGTKTPEGTGGDT